jgi:hypothetical protein
VITIGHTDNGKPITASIKADTRMELLRIRYLLRSGAITIDDCADLILPHSKRHKLEGPRQDPDDIPEYIPPAASPMEGPSQRRATPTRGEGRRYILHSDGTCDGFVETGVEQSGEPELIYVFAESKMDFNRISHLIRTGAWFLQKRPSDDI